MRSVRVRVSSQFAKDDLSVGPTARLSRRARGLAGQQPGGKRDPPHCSRPQELALCRRVRGGGTEASLLLCSQVETARANGSSLSDSLRLLCPQLPSNRSLAADKAVLPWNLDQTRIMLAAPEGGDGTQTGNRFPSPTGPILACSAITFAS